MNGSVAEPRVMLPISQALADGVLDRAELRALMRRSNRLPAVHLALWVALVAATGTLVWLSAGTGWWVPAMVVHGIVLVHHFSLQHECTHYTAFRWRPLNDWVAGVCGLVIVLGPTFFRYEHCDHHTWTQRPGRDPERIPLPTSLGGYVLYVSALPYWRTKLGELVRHAARRFNDVELGFIPAEARARVTLEARLMLGFYALLAGIMVATRWWDPLWYWLVPLLLGEPFMRAIRMTEHVGMPPVADMLRNTRTSLVAPPLRWLCWNMSYHAEHHYASSVPYHALPRLHRRLAGTLPVERDGYVGAHRDILAQILGRRPRADASIATGE